MKYLINLLPEKDKNFTGKLVYFSFHYLRYILVITQFVAICVFFYRFKVDQEIVDLKDTLTQKSSIVDSTKNLLESARDVDTKMKNIKKIIDSQDQFKSLYKYFFSFFANTDVFLTSFDIDKKSISLSGQSADVASVKLIIDKLNQEGKFKNIKLKNVNKVENKFKFDLSMEEFK